MCTEVKSDEAVHDDGNVTSQEIAEKPNCSLATLIARAILASGGATTLAGIYDYFTDNYTYFRSAPTNWRNRIRHTLTVSKWFTRLPSGTRRRGGSWSIDSEYADFFLADGTYVGKRGASAHGIRDVTTLNKGPPCCTGGKHSGCQFQQSNALQQSNGVPQGLANLVETPNCATQNGEENASFNRMPSSILELSSRSCVEGNFSQSYGTSDNLKWRQSCQRSLSDGNLIRPPDIVQGSSNALDGEGNLCLALTTQARTQCSPMTGLQSVGWSAWPAPALSNDMAPVNTLAQPQSGFGGLHLGQGVESNLFRNFNPGLDLLGFQRSSPANDPTGTPPFLAQSQLSRCSLDDQDAQATARSKSSNSFVEKSLNVGEKEIVKEEKVEALTELCAAVALPAVEETTSNAGKAKTKTFFGEEHTAASIENIDRLAWQLKRSLESLGRMSLDDVVSGHNQAVTVGSLNDEGGKAFEGLINVDFTAW